MILKKQILKTLIVGVCWVVLAGGQAEAAAVKESETVVIDTKVGEHIELVINRLAKFKSREVIKRAHVVNPEIAELVYSETQSPNWLFLSGKAIGATQLTIWNEDNRVIGSFEVVVRPDVAGLKRNLHEVFPGEDIAVRDSGEYITLTGTVSESVRLPKVLTLAEAYAPGKVINLLQVGGVQQVMLEVRVAEISKKVTQKLGINLAFAGDHGFALTMLDQLTRLPAEGWPGNPLGVSNTVNSIFGFVGNDGTFIATLDALQEDGLLKILAKPTLIAQSGHDASFLAGGEFPFPVAQSFDKVAIEWKPFGVALNFSPTVLGDGKISLLVSPEVSDLDFTKTISLSGFVIPSIDTRRMSTVVELRDNQSFAIAGLLKNYVRESVAKLPILGDIPILGALFRSTRYQKDETELVVIVTPHLVKPVMADNLSLPTDAYIDPNPFELMMLGMLEAEEKEQQGRPGEGGPMSRKDGPPALQGNFGYIIPE